MEDLPAQSSWFPLKNCKTGDILISVEPNADQKEEEKESIKLTEVTEVSSSVKSLVSVEIKESNISEEKLTENLDSSSFVIKSAEQEDAGDLDNTQEVVFTGNNDQSEMKEKDFLGETISGSEAKENKNVSDQVSVKIEEQSAEISSKEVLDLSDPKEEKDELISESVSAEDQADSPKKKEDIIEQR